MSTILRGHAEQLFAEELEELQKQDEALSVLQKAEAKASDDPMLTLELGEAYLGLDDERRRCDLVA